MLRKKFIRFSCVGSKRRKEVVEKEEEKNKKKRLPLRVYIKKTFFLCKDSYKHNKV